MIRFFARFWTKRKYIWTLEIEAETNVLSAQLSTNRAAEKRALAEQLNKEAERELAGGNLLHGIPAPSLITFVI